MKKTQKQIDSEVMEAAVFSGAVVPEQEKREVFDFDTFKFEQLSDFDIYNSHVRKHNRLCLHERNKMKVRVPDESFHKKVTVKFQRFDQPQNVLKCCVRNKDIDWKGQLKPGRKYELPVPVVKFLNNLSVPIFGEVNVTDGGETLRETKQIGEEPRFSCQVVDF